MSDYGLTPKGVNIKRLDTILDEMHDDLSERLGVNTRQNPQSFLNHILTNIADKCAELWEFGEDVYFSQYPSSAEGISLDNVTQYGGLTRESAAKSYYPIHCTGKDGTKLSSGTMISTRTNPTTYLTIVEDKQITRSSFNKAVIKVASAEEGNTYKILIDDKSCSFVSITSNESDIVDGLVKNFMIEDFEISLNEENNLITIESVSLDTSHTMVLSENLTTETVTSIITFGTVETGDILIPDNVITEIVKANAGLLAVVNLCGYVAGNNEETDAQLRKSYADKIFNRSSMMLESIRSAILSNVQGVESVAPYENDSDETDIHGRPPHSIEIVVDGGDATQIAQQILANKAAGISTFGSVLVSLPGVYDEEITIRFNRPETVYVWMNIVISLKRNETLPTNYVDLIKETILESIKTLDAGKDIVPQEFLSEIYKVCSGISYIDISLAHSSNSTDAPSEYNERTIEVSARQRVFVDKSMIEVALE